MPNIKRVDRTSFLTSLSKALESIHLPECLYSNNEIDLAVTNLTNTISYCANISKIKHRTESKPNKMSWWSDKLWDIRKRLRKALRVKNKSPSSLELYKELKAEYQREIRIHKTKAHQIFCTTNMNKDLFKSLKKLASTNNSKSDFPPYLLDKGSKVTNKADILKLFAKTFFPNEKPRKQGHEETVTMVEEELRNQAPPPPCITPDELHGAVLSLEIDSSPGEDGLSAELLVLCYPLIGGHLLCLLNSCLRHGYFPGAWKQARVCIIKKEKKESYREVKSYRPISVLNTLGKVFEKVIHKRLTWFATELDWFSTCQHGFMESKSTETAIHTLTHFVETNLSKGMSTAAVFLDISGAFDSAWPPSILQALITKKSPLYLTQLISSFLKERTAVLRSDDGATLHYKITIGCPQGSVLSPFLWNILFDKPIRTTFPFPYKTIAFADDLTILAAHKDPEAATANLQIMTVDIVGKTNDIQIDVNAAKTSFIVFTRMKVGLPELNLKINSTLVKPSQHCRYLGLELDNKLNWKRHVSLKCVAVKALIFSVQRYLRLTWGLNYKTLKLYYSAVLIPTMLYGVSIWAPALRYKWCKKLLRSTQRLMLKSMVRSFKSVSTSALIILSNTLPLDLKALEIALFSHKRNNFFPFV